MITIVLLFFTDECESNPCYNEGTCYEGDGTAEYNCSCVTGYSGPQCAEDISE